MPSVQHASSEQPNLYLGQLDNRTQDNDNSNQKIKSTSTENYLRSASNEKNIAMSNDRNFVKRGDLHGPIFELDHLATFSVGSKQGLLKAEDGMRKLRIMEKTQGIWTMDCQIMIDSNYLVVFDKKTGQEVEKFVIDLVHDPVSVVSDDKKDIYNNIILFTVLEDQRHKKSSHSPSEMHIFQCNKSHSAEIVDEIYKAKESSHPKQNGNHSKQDENNNYTKNLKMASNLAVGHHHQNQQMSPLSRRPTFTQQQQQQQQQRPNDHQMNPTRVEIEVQVLNHCFDDIERFVTRLQNSTEFFKELEKRQKHRKSHKKHTGDGMLGMRAQMPPPQQYIDIFQKFKHSFNLLAKLKAHIHDPNAPELVHFLFTPLSLIVNTAKEQPYRGLAKTVWNPLLTKDAKDLLLNCLTSKEQDLWLLLGDAWSVTVEDAHHNPQQYGHLHNQTYNPQFADGWSPTYPQIDMTENRNEFSKLAFATAAAVQAQTQGKLQQVPLQKTRYYANTQPQFEERSQSQSAQSRYPNIHNYESMKKWAVDLCYRGAKIYEVTHDRQATNEKELTIKVGELLEVLDDKRNWWRLRNYQGDIGHAPLTILRPFEFNEPNSFMAANNNGGQFDAEKFNDYNHNDNKKWSNLQMSQLSPETCSSSSSSSFSSENNLTASHQVINNSNSVIHSKTYLIKSSPKEDYDNPIMTIESGQVKNFNRVSNPNPSGDSFRALRPSEASTKLYNDTTNNTQNSNSYVYSNTSSDNTTQSPITPKASYNNHHKAITLNDQIKENPKQFLRKTTHTESKELVPTKNKVVVTAAELAPIKVQLHEEIVNRMSKKEGSMLKKVDESSKKPEIFISVDSTGEEVKKFLESKEFSQKAVLMFSELTGEQLFTLGRSDFETYCDKEEGVHLDSQIKVQKSLSGYVEKPTNELDNILKRRKAKSEMTKL